MQELKLCSKVGYKELARKTAKNTVYNNGYYIPLLTIDIRSCVFRHIRTTYAQRHSLNEKILCVLSLVNNGILFESKKVFDEALREIISTVRALDPKYAVYVFCSEKRCPFREGTKISVRQNKATKSKEDLENCIKLCKNSPLNIDVLLDCYRSFVTYLISNIEDICFINSGIKNSISHVVPNKRAFFESDRLCSKNPTVLSEDYDCAALFGAKTVIFSADDNLIEYVTLDNILDTFNCHTREQLVNKCIIMGTDYNLGIKGYGAKKVQNMGVDDASKIAINCLSLQNIEPQKLFHFFNI